MEVLMSDGEFSDIEIFQHSGTEIPLFMIGHKNCLQNDYFLGPGPRLKKKIYRAAVSQRFRDTGLEVKQDFEKATVIVLIYPLVRIVSSGAFLLLAANTFLFTSKPDFTACNQLNNQHHSHHLTPVESPEPPLSASQFHRFFSEGVIGPPFTLSQVVLL
jgi:hypothetical protein